MISEQKTVTLNKILLSIIAALVLVIISGTIISLFSKKQQPSPEVLLSQGKAVSLMAPVDNAVSSYFELGTMRIITKGTDLSKNDSTEAIGTVLVASPWLAYPAGDTVFYEEIARKRGIIKGVFQAYFSERTKNQILEETEVKIEEILKDQINELLSLGKISDIYFTEYIFIE